MSDGWNTDPFTLTVIDDDKMVGRGSTDDKGPICAWVNVLEAHQTQQLDLPVNLRFCFEAMEESGSEGLDDLVREEAAKGDQGYFDNVDCVCIVSTSVSTVKIKFSNLTSSRRLLSRTTTGSTPEHLALPTVCAVSCTSSLPSLALRATSTPECSVAWCTSP